MIGIVALVLIYLTWWTTYAHVHSSAHPRFTQLAPGASSTRGDGDWVLDSLVQTERLTADKGGAVQTADAGAVWVVAHLSVTPRVTTQSPLCEVALVGARGQQWKVQYAPVSRRLPSYCEDAVAGKPFELEALFLVPASQAGEIVGVGLPDLTTPDPTPVLRPAR